MIAHNFGRSHTSKTSRPKTLVGVLGLVLMLALALVPFSAFADDISNNLDPTVDAVAEVMSLNVGGANGHTDLYVTPRNGDSDNGCNFQGSGTQTLVVSVGSSNTSVATVSPSSITFGSCGDTWTLTITPHNQGSTTISVSQTSNNTGGTFNLAPATFTVNVAPPPNTPPSVSVDGVTGGASYDKGSVPATTCQVTDTEDGNSNFPATLSAITGPYASDGIGEQTASCSYTDGGGLTTSASKTYGIVDPTAPSITYTLTPDSPDGSNGWYKSDVSLTWNVSEPQSPNSLQKTGCVDQSITADQAATTYSCSATSAGGSAAPVEVSIKRDGTAPTVTGTANRLADHNGWYNHALTISWAASNNGPSGAGTCDADTNYSGPDSASASVSGQCTDGAGNVGTGSFGFQYDGTAPTLNPSVSPNPVVLNGSATASAGATDGLSGLDSSSCDTVDTNSVGSHSVSCTATDNAGNTNSASATYSVIYSWTGFFQPVDNIPTENVLKAGSAVPIKFSLSGNQGLTIMASGYPKSVAYACGAGAGDAVEETVTAGGSSLSYDATTGQYIYVWKTDKTWAGTCRQFQMKLSDGTTHSANFKFTR